MDEQIKEIIERQLPAQVGEVLRKRLEQAELDAHDLATVKGQRDSYKAERDQKQATIDRLDLNLKKHGELAAREEAVTKREQAIDLEIAKARAENAERSKGDLFNLVGLVFKNQIVKEEVFGGRSAYQPNGMMQSEPYNETRRREVE